MTIVGRAWMHAAIVAAVAAACILGNTNFESPPRFDGAGYAVLARSLMTGRGYREIDHPDAPRHAHYPPGYPLMLAVLWSLTGPSAPAAHVFSIACTLGAVLAFWAWFRRLYPPRSALFLALALALNWTWGRAGGEIQTEPPFLLLTGLAVLVAGRGGNGVALGTVLAAAILTRQVAATLAAALGLDLLIRGRTRSALIAATVAAILVAPWAAWLASVQDHTQLGLLAGDDWIDRLAGNAVFYVRRLPDQVAGPFVEVATVFGRSPRVARLADLGALIASGIVVFGWLRTLRSPRRRIAGLVPLLTLALLLSWPFTEAGRFLIPLVPFVLVGSVAGLAPVLMRFGLRRPRTWALWAVLAASLPYSLYALATGRSEAQRRTHAEFDAACAWIARHADRPGPILSRHPGEVFWLTGRPALPPPADDPDAIDRAISSYGVAYLLVDEARYARAPASALGRFVAARPGRVRRVWDGEGKVAVYVVRVED